MLFRPKQSPVIMIQIWQITPTRNIKLKIDAASLDEVTRQLPAGYYSTFRTFEGARRVLGLRAHLRRLFEPVSSPNVDDSFLRRQLSALLEPYRPGEARVRAIVTKGGEAYIAVQPLETLAHEVYQKGVHVQTMHLQRQHPRLKSTTFIGRSDLQRKQIAQGGIFEALLVKDGKVLEGMTSNFFYIPRAKLRERASTSLVAAGATRSAQREEILRTARDDILLGITRETVIDIARERGLEIKYEPLERDQLSALQEAFITSSSRWILTVVKIDESVLGQWSPGPVTKELMSAYQTYIAEHAERI